MLSQNPFRVGFFIDGFTFHKASDYYLNYHSAKSRISVAGIKSYLLHKARQLIPEQRSIVLEAHYYHPHENPVDNELQSKGVIKFEKQLTDIGFQFHYRTKNAPVFSRGNSDLINDLKMLVHFEAIQLAILVTTQGFYVDTAKLFKQQGIPLVVAGWDFDYTLTEPACEVHWRTDSQLREQAAEYIPLEQVMDLSAKHMKTQTLFLSHRNCT